MMIQEVLNEKVKIKSIVCLCHMNLKTDSSLTGLAAGLSYCCLGGRCFSYSPIPLIEPYVQ